ncbi:hypothetical protein AB4Y38_35470 [Paraburkholderia sp. EG285A]|uniref:hypothetical protein n=1 Tax=Paraburkholderia sp. EG285A TaxID=3237009 RepID=UPI0034D1CCB9
MYRIYQPGAHSVYCTNAQQVAQQCRTAMQRNLHGLIYLRRGEAWSLVARFEPWYGIVLA